MDTGSLLLITAIIILVVFIVSRPFYSSTPNGRANPTAGISDSDYEISELMIEKERLLSVLRDLDTDHDLGKIPDPTYHMQRERFMREAAWIMRSIDELEHASAADEFYVIQNGNSAEKTSPPDKWDEIEEQIAERRWKRSEKSAGFCPHCGKVLQKSDYFCPLCGAKV
ncbi:hypothetical protein hrd7_16200 [Leptolinea sp. HRD-7]|nr:hypothetical protein hrd7_16200 [Leptolinea sp. HRD-7]